MIYPVDSVIHSLYNQVIVSYMYIQIELEFGGYVGVCGGRKTREPVEQVLKQGRELMENSSHLSPA